MINFSTCPCPLIRDGYDEGGRQWITNWVSSAVSVDPGNDSSNGAVAAALASITPLYITSYRYGVGESFIFLNVMVNRRDYRLTIGFTGGVIRIEALDARCARARTRQDAQQWAPSHTPDTLSVADDNNNNNNTNLLTEIYSGDHNKVDPRYVPIKLTLDNPYVPIKLTPNNPYVPLPVTLPHKNPYGFSPRLNPTIGSHRK